MMLLDNDAEKGRRIKELIAASQEAQDHIIKENRAKIKENQDKIDKALKDGNKI